MEEVADHCGDVRDQCIGDVEAIEDAHLLLRERTEEMLPPGGGGVSLQHPSNLAACFPQFRIARAVRVRAEHHPATARSEEHTSELQSRGQLVCRLLREKKKQHTRAP